MTNTEGRIAIELEELALGDEEQMHEDAEQHITEADIRELALYGFDSEQRTLVGLGPVERARRAREAAAMPDSQRGPQSESPGPFIADDDEIPSSKRYRKLGPWAVAAPALLLVAIVALVTLRGLAPSAPHVAAASRPVAAVVARPPQDVPPPPAEVAPPPTEVAPPPAEVAPPPADLVAKIETASMQEATVSTERARVPVAVVSSALPVKLNELPPPPVVDMSSGADTSVGALNVTSNPPANVVLDGRPLGKAPRMVKVPAGLHTVMFIHPLYGRRTLSVNVGAGATTSASAEF
jgi:hypothetical protein